MIGCQPRKSKKEKTKERVFSNKEEFIHILRSTGRPGIEEVIRNLDSTVFFTMTAGCHHTEEGGLVQHSLEVNGIMKSIAWNIGIFPASNRLQASL